MQVFQKMKYFRKIFRSWDSKVIVEKYSQGIEKDHMGNDSRVT